MFNQCYKENDLKIIKIRRKKIEVLITTERLNICLAQEEDIPIIMQIENDKENKSFIWQGCYEEHLDEINSNDSIL
ncbi:hypothetical protein [Crassaminicella profunda]|uniref:hypothetical protein n=1 Tax=Crassaminicella profunda TaxID=1286698 RepID=UPI001CA71A62|nr:hypothetical protein [Crassaminicella profunda]QZY55814.1 hypothetical protein K7H06_02005 [Crassaminicella profunda]